MMTKWHALARPVHAWALLSFDSRQAAVDAARRDPSGALRCYRAIAASLRFQTGQRHGF